MTFMARAMLAGSARQPPRISRFNARSRREAKGTTAMQEQKNRRARENPPVFGLSGDAPKSE
jgi:hypothetical protein